MRRYFSNGTPFKDNGKLKPGGAKKEKQNREKITPPISPLRKLDEARVTRKYGGRMKLKGGSFPDLNKDGKITKADILMGRGVIPKKKNKKMKMAKKSSPRTKAMGIA